MPNHFLRTTGRLTRRSTKQAILDAVRGCVKSALIEYAETGEMGNMKPGNLQQAYEMAYEIAVDDARRHAGDRVPKFRQTSNPSDIMNPNFDQDPRSIERKKAAQAELSTWSIGEPADIINEIIEEHQMKQEAESLSKDYGEEIDSDTPAEERPSSRELIRQGLRERNEGFIKPHVMEGAAELERRSMESKSSDEWTPRQKIRQGLNDRFREEMGSDEEEETHTFQSPRRY